jgi:hypothetical protein
MTFSTDNPPPPIIYKKLVAMLRLETVSPLMMRRNSLFSQIPLKTVNQSVTHPMYGGCIQKFPDWPLELELQMLQLSATRCKCIAIL